MKRKQVGISFWFAESNKTKFESNQEKLMDDHKGDQTSRHPKTVEDDLEVMQACSDDHQKDAKKGSDLNQVDLLSKINCFKCKKIQADLSQQRGIRR